MYLLLGLGISNLAVYQKLKQLNKKIIVAVNENDISSAKEKCDIVVSFQELYYLNLKKIKYVIKSPGIPYHNKYIQYLKRNKLRIINEIELTYLLTNKKGKYIGVTGSVGKSTVVTILYELIKAKNKNVILAGNIGDPLINYIDVINKETIIILEVSSFQIDDFRNIRFNIALLLNIYDNHLDFYKCKKRYYLSKLNIVNNQCSRDYFITNLNNEIINKYIKNIKINSFVIDYKRNFNVINNEVYYKENKILNMNDFPLKGEHNLFNLMAVIVIMDILSIDISNNIIKELLPLKYHLETYKYNGINFINDSKSTSSASLKEAIKTYNNENLILLFGGLNKNLDFSFLSEYKFKSLICFGALSKNIDVESIKFDTLKVAIDYALLIAKSGDTVLFSPGCASFDEFSSYLKRGEFFDNYLRSHYVN